MGASLAQAARSADYSAFIGINTHLSDNLSPYGNTRQVKADLDYLGINQVRDTNPFTWSVGLYAALAQLGVKLDIAITHNPGEELGHGGIQADLALIHQLLQQAPGSVFAMEGQNEPWQFPDLYNGQPITTWPLVGQVQAAIYAAVKADPALAAIPLLSPSIGPGDIAGAPASFTATADLANVHVYPYGGLQPSIFITAGLAGQRVLAGSKSAWITEFGYSNTPGDASYGVDSATQAKNTLNGVLDAFKAGAGKVFLYQLFDETTNIPPNTPFGALGVFNADGTAKPVAVALHNLSTLLADPNAPASFQPGGLDVSVSGLPATASDTLFQKSDGTFELVLWNEATNWNPATQAEVAASPVQVAVHLAAGWGSISVFDPLVGLAPIATLANASTVSLSLTDHPLVIQIGGSSLPDRSPVSSAPITAPPITAPAPTAVSTAAVYRFFDSANGTHFFTADTSEALALITPGSALYHPSYIPEMNDFSSLPAAAAQGDPAAIQIYRLFDTSNGTHFYTASANELASIIQPATASYRPDLVFEPSASIFEHSTHQPGDVAVFRLFDAVNGTHLFLSDVAEYNSITTPGSGTYRADLKPEGVGFYAPSGAYEV